MLVTVTLQTTSDCNNVTSVHCLPGILLGERPELAVERGKLFIPVREVPDCPD